MKRREFLLAAALFSMVPFHAATAQQQVKLEVVGDAVQAAMARTPLRPEYLDDAGVRWPAVFRYGEQLEFRRRRPMPGPVPVVSYDGHKFTEEYTVNEEQIARYYQVGDTLFVAGA